MRQRGEDALLITAGPSLRYFTGIAWAASERLVAMLLTLSGDAAVLCPAFEEGSLQHALKIPARVHPPSVTIVVRSSDTRPEGVRGVQP